MDIKAVSVPYDAGYRGLRVGRGPEALMSNGLADSLSSSGFDISFRAVELGSDSHHEVASTFGINEIISREVRSGVSEGMFPLVLSGNCNSCVGTLAGVGGQELGIIWFDGHADFHTPETTSSGFTDCMGLSTAVGHCWKRMSARVHGFEPVPEENVVLVGTREIEPGEHKRLMASEVSVVGPENSTNGDILEKLDSALSGLSRRVWRVYLHLDLDVLDPARVGKANEFAPKGGLTVEEAGQAIQLVRDHIEIAAVGVASYDPGEDSDDAVLMAGVRLARAAVGPLASARLRNHAGREIRGKHHSR